MRCHNCQSMNVDVNGIFFKCNDCEFVDDSTFDMIFETINQK
jgi:hypothetical protein